MGEMALRFGMGVPSEGRCTRTPNKALKSYDLPTDFGQWSALVEVRRVWQQ